MGKTDLLRTFVNKLAKLSPLPLATQEAVLALPLVERTFGPGSYLLRECVRTTHYVVLLTGFAYRHTILGDGGRQILTIHMPGDGIGIGSALGCQNDHNLQALTSATAAFVPVAAVLDLVANHAQAMQALWLEALTEASISREWIANIGRRNARTRIAHLLCEIAERQASAGLAPRDSFHLPFNQEQLGDATGLTSVHVNRTLRTLGAEDAIRRDGRHISVPDWNRLAAIADFHPGYLQLAREPVLARA